MFLMMICYPHHTHTTHKIVYILSLIITENVSYHYSAEMSGDYELMGKDMLAMLSNDTADFTIVCQGQRIPVHKFMLCAR